MNQKYIFFLILILFVIGPLPLAGQEIGRIERQILVRFEQDRIDTDSYRRQLGAELLYRSGILNLEAWQLPIQYELSEKWLCSPPDFLSYIQDTFPVLYAEHNFWVQSATTPNDTFFHRQWAMENTGQNTCPEGNDINVLPVYEETSGSDSIKVGVIDSGIDWTHPDLIDNIWQNLGEDVDGDCRTIEWDSLQEMWVLDSADINGRDDDDWDNDTLTYIDDLIGWDFVNDDNNPMDDNGHGTHVSGIIGAKGNNEIGISGVCQKVSLMGLKALNAQGTGSMLDLIRAIEYSIGHGVRITNNSWSQQGFFSQALYDVIRLARDSVDQIFVAAAGNNGNNINVTELPVFPASFNLENIISVGAVDCNFQVPSFTNFGSISVDLMAPGDGIYSTEMGGTYAYRSGTSMAAPFVAGAAALILSENIGLSYEQLRGKLLYNTTKRADLDDMCQAGGVLNVAAAYEGPVLDGERVRGLQSFYDEFSVLEIIGNKDDIWMVSTLGVVHFDKIFQQWEIFNKSNSPLVEFPNSSSISPISIDSSGHVYLFSSDSLWKYNGLTWNQINFPFNGARSLKFSGGNQLWIGGPNTLVVFQNDSLVIDYSSLLPANSSVVEIEFETDSIIWLNLSNPQGNRVYEFDISSGTIISDSIFDPYTRISTIHVRDTTLIFSNRLIPNRGLYEKNGDSIHQISSTQFPQFPSNISSDASGALWYQSHSGSFTLSIETYQDSSFTTQFIGNVPQDLSTHYYVYVDDRDWIWVGTVFGVHVWDRTNPWISYDPFSSEMPVYIGGPQGLISFVRVDSKNRIWMGRNEGLSILDDGVWKFVDPTATFQYLANQDYLRFDEKDNAWYLSHDDHMLQRKIFQILSEEIKFWDFSSITDAKTFDVLNDSTLLLGSAIDGPGGYIGNGIVKATFHENDSIALDTILLYLDPSGHGELIDIEAVDSSSYWISNGNGLFIFDPDSATIDTAVYFPANPVHDSTLKTTYDPDNQIIWAYNYFNVFKFSESGAFISRFELPPLLSGDAPTYLEIDPNGFAWIMFSGSEPTTIDSLLFKLIKILPDSTFLIKTNDELDIPAEGLEPRGFAIDSSGLFWINLNTGILTFDPNAGPSFSVSNFSICAGDSLLFNNYSPAADSFAWLVNGIEVSTDSNLFHPFPNPGTFEVGLVSYSNGEATGFSQFIQVKPVPVLDFLKDDTTACADAIYLFGGPSDLSYTWFDSTGDTLGLTQGLVARTSGQYLVQGTDVCGLSDWDSIEVTLTKDSTCNCSCVWPGDVDANGWVNIHDFLILGTLFGDSGTIRTNASSDFVAQGSLDWGDSITHALAAGLDKKHADCNGDGIIDEQDMALVFQHAQGAFPKRTQSASAQIELQVKPRKRRVELGDSIHFDAFLFDKLNDDIQNGYGIGFTMEYNLSGSNKPVMNSSGSWLGTIGTDMAQGFIRYGNEIDFALTRTDKMPVMGKGKSTTYRVTLLAEDIDTSRQVKHLFLTANTANSVLLDPTGIAKPITNLSATSLETVVIDIPWLLLDVKVFLQGAWDSTTQQMHTQLNDLGLLPLLHPYGDLFQADPDSLPDEVVDWVVVELREATDPKQVVSRRAVWLTKSGSLMDPEEGPGIALSAPHGSYYIVVDHRNHLPVMSAIPLALSDSVMSNYDFTTAINQAFGTKAMIQLDNQRFAMIVGDVNGDGQINYTGLMNDREAILNQIGSTDPTAIILQYSASDLDMNGEVKYSGKENDRAFLLRILGGDDPLATRIKQVPD